MLKNSEFLNRRQPPMIHEATLPSMPRSETLKLSCGLKVFLLPDYEADGTRLEFILPAGSSWHHNPLTASFTIALLREGSHPFPGPKLIRELDKLGVFIDLQSSADYAWLTAYAHKNTPSSFIRYLSAMLAEPQFTINHFRSHRKRQHIRFQTDILRTQTLANRAFINKLFGSNTSYGRVVEEADYQNIELSDVSLFHNRHYSADRTILILAGYLRNEWLHELDECLKDFCRPNAEATRQEVSGQKTTGLIMIEKPDALQSSIVMGRLIVDRNHPDFPALSLLTTILGGYFGSRLMSNLREDKGFTYGVYSQIQSLEMATRLSISTEVGTAVTQQAIDQIRLELVKLQNEAVPDHELNLVKNYLSGTYTQALDGSFNKALRLRNLIPSGINLDYYQWFLQQIYLTNSEMVMLMARKYFSPGDMLIVVAGSNQRIS
jgi:predicted Zn-dependent peptidase